MRVCTVVFLSGKIVSGQGIVKEFYLPKCVRTLNNPQLYSTKLCVCVVC